MGQLGMNSTIAFESGKSERAADTVRHPCQRHHELKETVWQAVPRPVRCIGRFEQREEGTEGINLIGTAGIEGVRQQFDSNQWYCLIGWVSTGWKSWPAGQNIYLPKDRS